MRLGTRPLWLALGLLFALIVPAIMFRGSGGSSVSADVQTSGHLHIDADPTNGAGPCDIIDAMRTVAPSTVFTVAVCMDGANLAPISGGFNTAQITMTYGPELTAANVASDLTTDLNSNPDWNQAGLSGPQSWDCNQLNNLAAAPKASPSPAFMSCTTTSSSDQPVTGTVLLATVTFTAASNGTTALTFGGVADTNILAGANEADCGSGFTCTSATIQVGLATPTPTPTPTNTPTPTPTLTPTSTPPPTSTPTPSATSTATPTRVPGACPGDVNLDAFVDAKDLAFVARRLHAFAPDPRYDTQADIDGDGAITARDLKIVIHDIRTGC